MVSPLPFISLFEDDDSRWQAVVARNSNADGFFVYAVKTTKIFCRPICKARLARRANVSFYATGQDAQRAGFRACKRCKPEMAGFMPEEAAVQKIRAFVHNKAVELGRDGAEARLSLSQMARQTGLSKWHFHRVFKRCVGMTPTEYLREQRMRESHGHQLPDGQVEWLDTLNIEAFDPGLEPEFWDDALLATAHSEGFVQQSSTEASSTAVSESSPWSMDDFVVWPEA
ncbi:hypothetical protein B0T10DRAFT_453184 [Thelonectria olida]|uniref:HTH araC/xylS-type domain-containing protein n=1 Tax=Thelonectria olida TaxID=1576542 RepID=A0A9P8WJL7_9HYPO|nr:hypothetical protein B0T10DRAFT_453184 [Thelonectria olida]